MKANYEYVLQKCRELCSSGRILDFGCGGGGVVEAGRALGLDIVGVEVFYEGNQSKEVALRKGLLGNVVFELQANGTIPFADASFSMVVSNQVFEHVKDLYLVLAEVFRVLQPGGILLALFPSREVWREGHCGIPFAHWFKSDSRLRYPYMRFMRALGLGHHKTGKSHAEWVRHKLAYLDYFTAYRSRADTVKCFARVTPSVVPVEEDYLAFRLRRTRLRWAARSVRCAFLRPVVRLFCRTFAGMVLLARKPDAGIGHPDFASFSIST